MNRGLKWALVALAGVALLAGCGESEQEKYTNKLNSIVDRLGKDERKVTRGSPSPTTPPQAAKRARQIQAVLTRAVRDFEAVKPPSKVKDLHQRLVGVIRSFAGAVTPEIQAADSGDLARFRSQSQVFSAKASSIGTQLNALRREYRARGYKLK